MRLLLEIIGWVLAAVGAYYLFEDKTLIIPYVILTIGIILLVITIPKSFRKWKEK